MHGGTSQGRRDEEGPVGARPVRDVRGQHEVEQQIGLGERGPLDHPVQEVPLRGLVEVVHDHVRRPVQGARDPGVLGEGVLVAGVQDQKVHLDAEVLRRVGGLLAERRNRVGAGPVRGQGQADFAHDSSPVDCSVCSSRQVSSPSSLAPSSFSEAASYLSDSCRRASPTSVLFQSGVLRWRQDSTRERRSSWLDSSSRHHREVLDGADTVVRAVAGHAVREHPVPDQQVTGFEFGPDHGELGAVDSGPDGVAVGGLLGLPLLEAPEELGRALESAVVRAGVVERDDALDPLRQHAERGVHVPVQLDVEARVGGLDERAVAVLDVGRVQVEPVQGDPQLLAVPHVDEGVVHALGLPAVPDELVVVGLDEAVDVQVPLQVGGEFPFLVPGFGARGIEALEFPREVEQAPRRRRGYRLFHDHVAIRLPEREVLLGKHPQRPGFPDVLQRGSGQIRLTAVRTEVGSVRRGSIEIGVGRRHARAPKLEMGCGQEDFVRGTRGHGRPTVSD